MKHKLLRVFTFSLMLVVTLAHADFRKAVDAYVSRDAETLLKEVRSSVENKNNEGLLLFLHAIRIDASTSAKSNLYEGYKDKRITPTSLETLLSATQQKELETNLSIIVKSSDIETQYLHAIAVLPIFKKNSYDEKKKINDTFIKSGSYAANAFNSDLISRSAVGDPFSQFQLGLKYLHFRSNSGFGCESGTKEQVCLNKNEGKGFELLKQALKTSEFRGHDNLGIITDALCEYFQENANKKSVVKQANLWCWEAYNTGGNLAKKYVPDRDHKQQGSFPESSNELPDWIAEIRKEAVSEGAPIFSFYTNDYMDFELDVYANGIVKVGFGSTSKGYQGDDFGYVSFLDIKKDMWLKVRPEKIEAFLDAFKKMTATWELNSEIPIGFCDSPDASGCKRKFYQATIRDRTDYRRLYFSGLVWPIAKLQGVEKESEVTIKIGKTAALVEKYFPTQKLRCGLSNSSDFKQKCIDRDNRWINLAREEM